MDNIIENNKLIAEFMDFQPTSLGWFDNEEHLINVEKDNTFDNLKFHKDWNWLMEVVERIESMDFVLNIRQGHVSIVNNSGKTPFYTGSDLVEESKIEAVYNACIEFIKWYNNKNI